MKNTEEYKKFVSLALEQISNYLWALGYTYQCNEFYKDSLNIERVKIKFENKLLDRSIEFHHSKNNYGKINRSNISVFIQNSKRSYILEDILKNEKINYESSKFSLLSYEGVFEQRITSFYSYLIDLFENAKIKKWLLGDKWADIPFDWGQYK